MAILACVSGASRSDQTLPGLPEFTGIPAPWEAEKGNFPLSEERGKYGGGPVFGRLFEDLPLWRRGFGRIVEGGAKKARFWCDRSWWVEPPSYQC